MNGKFFKLFFASIISHLFGKMHAILICIKIYYHRYRYYYSLKVHEIID